MVSHDPGTARGRIAPPGAVPGSSWKNKGFFFMNLAGLSIGIAIAMLLLLWIRDERAYDQFHEKKDRVYEAWNKMVFSGEIHCWNTTPKALAAALKKDIPEIELAVRASQSRNFLFSAEGKSITAKGNIVDSSFLQVFSFPLLEGNPLTALNGLHSIILTESLAEKIFGKTNAMGKRIAVEGRDSFTVTGIAKDPPPHTRFHFEYLIPWAYLRYLGKDDSSWRNNSTHTYVLLKTGTTPDSIAPRIKRFKESYDHSEPGWEMFLYPMSRWRLYGNFRNGVEQGGEVMFVRLSGAIALLILLLVCIRFMKLSTARAESQTSPIVYFIGESMLLALLAGIIALLIAQASLPAFNRLTDKHLSPFHSS